MTAEATENDQADTTSVSEGGAAQRIVVGRVVSSKMNQGVTVSIDRLIQHPVYGKYIRRTSKVMAHDEDNSCSEGDTVEIVECRPISKRKSWRVVKIIETNEAS